MYTTGQSDTNWSNWGDWIWHPEYQRYYRQRQDIDGKLDTDWAPQDDQIPRESSIDDITAGVANTHLHNPSSATYDQYNQEYVTSGSSRHKSKPSRSKSSKPKSSSSRSKGKSRADADDEYSGELEAGPSVRPRESVAAGSGAPGDPSYYDMSGNQYQYQDSYGQQAQPGYGYQQGYHPTTYADAPSTSAPSYPTIPEVPDGADAEDEEAALQAAINQSRQYNYATTDAGPSSAAYGNYYEDDGPPTPKAGGMTATHIAGSAGEYEQLDPRYRVEHSNRFQPGEIFKVLWSEPQGIGAGDGAPSVVSERYELNDKYGLKFFIGFRRFIVIANDQGHCTCVPILTYGGKGCNKKGVKPDKHGIIYEKGHKARLLSGEPKLGFTQVRVEITQDGEKLSKESRVNYSKLITVEHNVKVFFIGRVTQSDFDIVADAVNRCWEDKIHHRRKRFS